MKTTKVRNIITNITTRAIILTICMSLLTLNSFAQKRSFLDNSAVKEHSENLAAVQPIFFDGNPSCETLNLSSDSRLSHITTNNELKLDSPLAPFNGTYNYLNNPPSQFLTGAASSSNNVTINSDGTTFSWTSSLGIAAVIVKGGPDANVYPYPQASFGDTNLNAPLNPRTGRPFGLSHISFCYYMPASVTIIKEVNVFPSGTASTQSFPFTATPNFGTTNFSLVDNNSQPADRITNSALYSFGNSNSITITESMVAGWSLNDINCVSTAGGGLPNIAGNTTWNLATRSANIVLEQGENVVCTFTNGQVAPSAASAFISGRVLTETGLPLRRAAITVFNANTLETQTVYTNQLGYYRVDNLPVNDFYIVSVAHGKRAFANNSQSFTLSDNLTDVNFFVLY